MTSPNTIVSAPRTRTAAKGAGRYVLRARTLRPGAILSDTACFGDDIWSLSPAILQEHQKSLALDFTTIPAASRLVAKELFDAMLSGDLPPGEPRPGIATTRGMFSHVKLFLTWVHDRAAASGQPGCPVLADLCGQDLLAYARHLRTAVPLPGTRVAHRCSVRLFWRYRNCLSADRLAFDPLHVEGWGEPKARAAATENATDRIPEHVHGPLLAWALRLIDDFSADILAADRQWHATRNQPSLAPQNGRGNNASGKLTALLDKHLAAGRPLPGYRGKLNLRALARNAGCSHRLLSLKHRAAIDAVAAVVGVHHHTPYDITIEGRIDGEAWIEAIVEDPTQPYSVGTLARMLQAATYFVIGFLSGMRDSEIKHLRRGCLRVERGPDGAAYRYKVTSLAFKGETNTAGVTATWVLGAPAARAIQILEQLQPASTELLFANLIHSSASGPARHSLNAAMRSNATNSQLNELAAWINKYCTDHGRTDVIPAVNKQPWRLSTRQLRRTLAWFIARRPGGAIAGAIAYRHLSVQMFEGYSGTSDSGFRAEVEGEQALARGEHLLAMADQHEHQRLAGPAAEEANRRLEQFSGQARFDGKVITDEQRLKRLMRRDDPAIYPGKYATCVHNHATALCRQRPDSQGRTRPDTGSCKPFACRNVALTAENTSQLRHEAELLQQELHARPLLPPLLQQELRARVEQIHAFLNQYCGQTS